MWPTDVKVRSLLEHSCSILISFKIVVIFNTTSADIKIRSADFILKMTTILKEMRVPQLCSKSELTLDIDFIPNKKGQCAAVTIISSFKYQDHSCNISITTAQMWNLLTFRPVNQGPLITD